MALADKMKTITERLEPHAIGDGINELALCSLAISMKRLADKIDSEPNPSVYLGVISSELHNITKEVNAGVRHDNPLHPQVF